MLEGSTPVGVRTFRNRLGLPVRVFYPANSDAAASGAPRARWWSVGMLDFVDGHTSVFGPAVLGKRCKPGTWLFWLLSFGLRCLAFVLPLRFAHLPRCFEDVEPADTDERIPLVVWSHGLTGCGDEHGLMAAFLASSGMVVALVQHGDGSSSKVHIGASEEGPARTVYYQHPDISPGNYDSQMRQRGCERRAKEIETTRVDMFHGKGGLQSLLDPARVVVGGFSFGAMTSSLVATLHPDKYCGVVCHDGWFNIFIKSLDVNQDMPAQAHVQGISIPALFVGSAEFQSYKEMCASTARLQQKCKQAEVHTMEHSKHWNFMDLVVWLPLTLSRVLKLHRPGLLHAHESYRWLLVTTRAFIQRATTKATALRASPRQVPTE